MKFIQTYCLSVGFLLLLASCSENQTQTVLFTTACNGLPLQLQLINHKSFDRTYDNYRLTYNGKEVAVIDNPHGHKNGCPPYDSAVYGKAPWHYVDTTRQTFRVAGYSDSAKKVPVMLFVDAVLWTPQEFEQLYLCLKNHHRAMQRTIYQVGDFHPYQFGGMVYGGRKMFVQRYEKTEDDYFEIYPDGQIVHTDAKSSGMTVTSSNGLSYTIQMPGKRVLYNPAQISPEDLQDYRNTKTNRSLPMDFALQVDSSFHSR